MDDAPDGQGDLLIGHAPPHEAEELLAGPEPLGAVIDLEGAGVGGAQRQLLTPGVHARLFHQRLHLPLPLAGRIAGLGQFADVLGDALQREHLATGLGAEGRAHGQPAAVTGKKPVLDGGALPGGDAVAEGGADRFTLRGVDNDHELFGVVDVGLVPAAER